MVCEHHRGAGEVNIKIKQTNLEPDGDHAASEEQATSEPASHVAMPNEVARLLHGRVRIGGLQGRSELNGQCGRLHVCQWKACNGAKHPLCTCEAAKAGGFKN